MTWEEKLFMIFKNVETQARLQLFYPRNPADFHVGTAGIYINLTYVPSPEADRIRVSTRYQIDHDA